MCKIFLLVSLLLAFGVASADDTSAVDVRARSGSAAASALIKAAGDQDTVVMRGQRPWNNTPTQDRARIAGCLRILGTGVVVVTGAVLCHYMRMQSICHQDNLLSS